MTTKPPNTSFSERRLQHALTYVSDYWMPFNSDLCRQILTKLDAGQYHSQQDSIVLDIQGDLSLFLYCIRRLRSQINNETARALASPVDLLHQSSLAQLQEILENDIPTATAHLYEQGGELQIDRIREAILSISSAEVLSQHSGIDRETAYSAALFRQLGLTLVAWNYPLVYRQSLLRLRSGDQLELRLAETLGFTPTTLALRLLSEWGFRSKEYDHFGLKDGANEHPTDINCSLVKLCKVGEALARAQHPETYPDARNDWDLAIREITSQLGADGIEQIQERYEENIENYVSFMPHLFESGLMTHYEKDYPSESTSNPYLTRCRPRVRRALATFYSQLDKQKLTTVQLRQLVFRIFPLGGFTGGCVYTADPGNFLLIPQLTVGNVRLRKITAIDYSLSKSHADAIALAYESSEAILEYNKSDRGDLFTGIAGLFGYSQNIGVLYLEIPGIHLSNPQEKPLIHFNAFRFALGDCFILV